jgi:hypothetical protein
MGYLMFLKRTHKAEVTEALATDPILEKELEYDLKHFAREEALRSKGI